MANRGLYSHFRFGNSPGILGFEIADSCGFKRESGDIFVVAWLTNFAIF
jgi:hypothetical protein